MAPLRLASQAHIPLRDNGDAHMTRARRSGNFEAIPPAVDGGKMAISGTAPRAS